VPFMALLGATTIILCGAFAEAVYVISFLLGDADRVVDRRPNGPWS